MCVAESHSVGLFLLTAKYFLHVPVECRYSRGRHGPRRKGRIRPPHDIRIIDPSHKRRNSKPGGPRARKVKVEAPRERLPHKGLRQIQPGIQRAVADDAVESGNQAAPRVRDDPFDACKAARHLGVQEVGECARRVEGKVERWRGELSIRHGPVQRLPFLLRDGGRFAVGVKSYVVMLGARRRRVLEDGGVQLVQRLVDGVQGRVAEVHAVVVGHEDDAVWFWVELVEAVVDFVEGGLDIWKWERREEAESMGVLGLEARCVFIDLAGEPCGIGGCDG